VYFCVRDTDWEKMKSYTDTENVDKNNVNAAMHQTTAEETFE